MDTNDNRNMEDKDPLFDESNDEGMQSWLQENLRVIVSVFIVGAIALGIYSYSQRSVEEGSVDTDRVAEEAASTETGDSTSEMAAAPQMKEKIVAPGELSRETASSFVEVAAKGDSRTTLARRALLNHLEKNVDSTLTAEHKVYAEDWLRKHVSYQGSVKVGTSIEYDKDLVDQAIAASKTLSEKQLMNLKKYSQRVSVYRV